MVAERVAGHDVLLKGDLSENAAFLIAHDFLTDLVHQLGVDAPFRLSRLGIGKHAQHALHVLDVVAVLVRRFALCSGFIIHFR